MMPLKRSVKATMRLFPWNFWTRESERGLPLAQLLLLLRSSPEKLLGRPDLALSCLVGGVERLEEARSVILVVLVVPIEATSAGQ